MNTISWIDRGEWREGNLHIDSSNAFQIMNSLKEGVKMVLKVPYDNIGNGSISVKCRFKRIMTPGISATTKDKDLQYQIKMSNGQRRELLKRIQNRKS